MGQSGVGALPLLALPSSELQGTTSTDAVGESFASLDAAGGGMASIKVPSEETLMEDTMNGIKVLFERQKRSQESTAVVANLLGGTR